MSAHNIFRLFAVWVIASCALHSMGSGEPTWMAIPFFVVFFGTIEFIWNL